ncbi:ArnT family glycosyltransferase [Calycomorphotria hydatis]|uniref:ArnT family glycosyltransferase n=1 Tax=Calycomorphotria hydatis TaxID=2528027 RepID=UPI0018D210B7|nr:glycosyltransferase family 39 protein [Calycomorphotria hydatis]
MIGFLLRAANLTWGTPALEWSRYHHPDERKSTFAAAHFPEEYLASESYLYGTAVQYTVGTFMLPAKIVYLWINNGDNAIYELWTTLAFRFVNVILGTATILLIFTLGRKLFNEQVGLFGAVLLTFAPFHCWNSGFGTLDVPMSFLLVVCFLTLLRICESPCGTKHFALLGLTAGLLLSTKVIGGLFLLVATAVLSINWILNRPGQSPQQKQPSKRQTKQKNSSPETATPSVQDFVYHMGIVWLVAACVFAITTPHAALSLNEYLHFMQQQKSNWYDRSDTTATGPLLTWFYATASAAGYLAAILWPFSLYFLHVNQQKKSQRLISLSLIGFVICYLAFWGSYLPARFVIFISPIICLLAGLVCGEIERKRRHFGSGLIIFSTLISASIYLCGAEQQWNDTRLKAARYLHHELPSGSTLGIASNSTDHHWAHHEWRYPWFDSTRYQDTPFWLYPEYLITTSYELDRFRDALDSPRLSSDFEWDPEFKGDWYQNTPPGPSVFRFYADLLAEKDYELIREYQPAIKITSDAASPGVFIYRHRSEATSSTTED